MEKIQLACLENYERKIETARSGHFVFQLGVNLQELLLPIQRLQDAHQRFASSPLAEVANQLEKEVVVSSIFGTNTIEGGQLTEEETEALIELNPAQIQEIEQRRVINLKAAYIKAQMEAKAPNWQLSIDFMQQIHALITQDIPHPDNRPGVLRDTPKGRMTYVGAESHGGRYKPPQYGGDVARLLHELVDWHQTLEAHGVSPLIRAPLVHYYYELIHPFWDGNGRVGRVIEASILLAAGYRYAPFALARFYLDNIHVYFTLFNQCRKAAGKHQAYPNTPFVLFHQEGMLATVNHLHDRVNRFVSVLLFERRIRQLLDNKTINARQHTILAQIMGRKITVSEIRTAPWYQGLYLKLSEKTKSRDLKQLVEMGLLGD